MKKVKSLAHACEVLGITIDLAKFSELGLPAADVKPLADYYAVTKIVEATNKLNNWKANWSDSRQYKYSPWFWVKKDASKPSGFGLADVNTDDWNTITITGSRLCVGSAEEARYIGETFIDLFESAWLIIEQQEGK